MESKGEDFFDENGLAFGPELDYAWEPYARAALSPVSSWRQLRDRTAPHGRCHCVGCVLGKRPYYSNIVTYPNNSSEQVEIVSMPCPTFEGGEKMSNAAWCRSLHCEIDA